MSHDEEQHESCLETLLFKIIKNHHNNTTISMSNDEETVVNLMNLLN